MLCGEKLGKGKRVVIPSCVVKSVREKFPEANEDYTGFKSAFENNEELFQL